MHSSRSFLVKCQFKQIQRNFIDRNYEIDSELKNTGIMQYLRGAGKIEIVGTAAPDWKISGPSKMRFLRFTFVGILHEARLPNTF